MVSILTWGETILQPKRLTWFARDIESNAPPTLSFVTLGTVTSGKEGSLVRLRNDFSIINCGTENMMKRPLSQERLDYMPSKTHF